MRCERLTVADSNIILFLLVLIYMDLLFSLNESIGVVEYVAMRK